MSHYIYRTEVLEAIARKVIAQYDPGLLHTPAPIPVEVIMEKVYGLTIEYQYIRKNGRILGETVFEDAMVPVYEHKNNEGYKLIHVKAGTVIIDAQMLNNRKDGRLRYTCSHELAHWIIHKEYFTQLGETAAMTKKAVRSSETDASVERQADYLASCLLMPKGMVKMAYYRNSYSKDIVSALSELFCVSNKAMEIRLTEMHLFT